MNPIEKIATLYNNPFLFAPILPAFYRSLGEKEKGLLLAYLVLPLVLPIESRRTLSNLNKRSSLRSFVKNRNYFYGLGRRIGENRKMTNLVLQYNLDMGHIKFDDKGSMEVQVENLVANGLCGNEILRAAQRLGKIFQPHSVPVIYLHLGIKSL